MIAAIVAAFALQADPPPFLDYIEEAEALGRAGYMAGACVSLGIIEADGDALDELEQDFRRRAVLARTDGPIIEAAIQRGIERERAASTMMFDLGPDDGSARRLRREAQAVEYFGAGCADLALDYPSAFRMSGDD